MATIRALIDALKAEPIPPINWPSLASETARRVDVLPVAELLGSAWGLTADADVVRWRPLPDGGAAALQRERDSEVRAWVWQRAALAHPRAVVHASPAAAALRGAECVWCGGTGSRGHAPDGGASTGVYSA